MYLSKIEQTEDNDHLQHGNCEFLARALFDEFGYSTIFVVDLVNDETDTSKGDLLRSDEELYVMSYWEHIDYGQDYGEAFPDAEVPYINICHCFGKAERDGKTYYIDSTGITDDINDILKNFGLSEEKIENDGCYDIFEYEDPYANEDYFWSTYYDWYGCVNFEEETEKERIIPTAEFLDEHYDELNIDTVLERQREKEKGRPQNEQER